MAAGHFDYDFEDLIQQANTQVESVLSRVYICEQDGANKRQPEPSPGAGHSAVAMAVAELAEELLMTLRDCAALRRCVRCCRYRIRAACCCGSSVHLECTCCHALCIVGLRTQSDERSHLGSLCARPREGNRSTRRMAEAW